MSQLAIEDISFPVFPLRTYRRAFWEDGVYWIETEHNTYALDDTNVEGDTVGIRRLRTCHKVYPLGFALYTLIDLQKRKKAPLYIDNSGKIFKYIKSKFYYVYSYKITSAKVIEGKGYWNYIKSLDYGWLAKQTDRYAELIHTKNAYIVYNYSDVKVEPFRIKL